MKQKHVHNVEKSCFLTDGPLISVVVPVYNAEKYLARCLDSILDQIYEHIEVIAVDDGSTDKSAELLKRYLAQDERMRLVRHETNRGLFQARLSGSDAAKGRYLAFVDSDDYICADWFRTLVKKAEETGADMVVGDWCFDYGDRREYCNLDPFRLQNLDLRGDAVLRAFLEQEGRSFSWSVVWNKLYTKALWNKCLPMFRRFSRSHGHMLMWEDVAFSGGLWSRAERAVNVHHVNYFYCKHEGASTANSRSRTRNLKYIADASAAMEFLKEQLVSAGRYQELEAHFTGWKRRYANIVYHDLVTDLGQKRLAEPVRRAFHWYGDVEERDTFFYRLTTPLQEPFAWYEDIKRRIASPSIRYVSFDMFDTLVQRAFLHPEDLFQLLSDEVGRNMSAYLDFAKIRIHAEAHCREQCAAGTLSQEEITLDEIYADIQKRTVFAPALLRHIQDLEEKLEVQYSSPRRVGKELYELAKDAGKEIVICSDMYLSRAVIEAILAKNGYRDYKKLYLSSELQVTKAQKTMYAYVKKDLRCKRGGSMVHIGDNWASDVEHARKCGLSAGHLCKAADMLQNRNPGIYAGQAYAGLFQGNGQWKDYGAMLRDFPGLRSVLALAANRVFDNPYVSFHPDSDFNADPYFIGYFALGPHLLALAKWVAGLAEERHIPTVHFAARDGYMVKQAFDVVNQTAAVSSYIRLSRRSLLLADVNRKEDLYSLGQKLNPLYCSPKALLEYLRPIIPKEARKKAESLPDRRFQSQLAFEDCLKLFLEEFVDFSMLTACKDTLRRYFSGMVKPGDYIFDVGYSGRPESALSSLLGFPVGSLYVHINSDAAMKRQSMYQCPSACFYSAKPCVTGVIREHLLMELGPSTTGYEEHNGVITPRLEPYKPSYESDLMTKIMQDAAMDFVREFHETFQDRLFLPLDGLSAPFEYYLHHAKPFDRQIFSALQFEDKLGEGKAFSALAFWNRALASHGLLEAGAPPSWYLPPELEDLYLDGLFVKLYRRINKWFPKGGWARSAVKRIAGLFLR